MTDIKNQLKSLENVIQQAKLAANRQHEQVDLLAVSKTWPAEKLRLAAEAGQRQFGENYLQEALSKINELADLNLTWHFIGPIQSNKTKEIAQHFDWVQSIDRLKIAKRLNEQRPKSKLPLQICIQINIDDEDSKSGISADQLMTFATEMQQFENLQLRGLMFIPAKSTDPQQQLQTFKVAHNLFTHLQAEFENIDTLSMGMSGDMEAAINAGSTMVRVGTALFGQRNTKPKQ
jgi:hypothetical protein